VPVWATARASGSARSPWSEARRLASVGPPPALSAGGRLRMGKFDDRTPDRSGDAANIARVVVRRTADSRTGSEAVAAPRISSTAGGPICAGRSCFRGGLSIDVMGCPQPNPLCVKGSFDPVAGRARWTRGGWWA
jgi:hypothetical protein